MTAKLQLYIITGKSKSPAFVPLRVVSAAMRGSSLGHDWRQEGQISELTCDTRREREEGNEGVKEGRTTRGEGKIGESASGRER